MVSAEASGALSPMAAMAAMAKPKNRRMGRELLVGFVLLGRHVVFMFFWVLFSGFCFFVFWFFCILVFFPSEWLLAARNLLSAGGP
jgi:hypothetical protein